MAGLGENVTQTSAWHLGCMTSEAGVTERLSGQCVTSSVTVIGIFPAFLSGTILSEDSPISARSSMVSASRGTWSLAVPTIACNFMEASAIGELGVSTSTFMIAPSSSAGPAYQDLL